MGYWLSEDDGSVWKGSLRERRSLDEAEVVAELNRQTERIAELEAALQTIIEAWECSDGGAGGVESIAAAIDAARGEGKG